MLKLFLILILMSSIAMHAGTAAEIDSVTPRRVELIDSLALINEIFYQRIKAGIENANQQPVSVNVLEEIKITSQVGYCDEENLYTELRKAIFNSFTASWGLKGYDLDKQLRHLLAKHSYVLSLNDSIYRDINYLEGFSLKLKELSDVVKIRDHLIGLDKIGHFFAQGWQYFEMTEYDEKGIDDALAWGRERESGLFGYKTTGIFSFADLVANLNGWRFWNKVLRRHHDPLKSTLANLIDSPYVKCKIQIIDSIKAGKIVKAWEYNTRFDMADYIDGAWDEGNNCNSYADPIIEEKVTSRIRSIDADFACPLNSAVCRKAQDRYGDFAKQILHPYCLTAQ